MNAHLLDNFVAVNALHAQHLYTRLKFILTEIIRFPEKYVRTETDREVLRHLLDDQLVAINENMKTFFLDKYFAPYNRGYPVKLLRT